MARRFSASLLYRVRNEIEKEHLLNHLNWPCKHREGVFCFLCPRCGEFLSGVNRRTNLGRCFACKTNFNPIDFVMAATDRDFVSAVEFLLAFLGEGSCSPACPPPRVSSLSPSPRADGVPFSHACLRFAPQII